MKGVKKCFLYLFTLMVVSLASCLGICSHNTSALKHQLSAMPLYRKFYYIDDFWSFGGNYHFEITQPNMDNENGRIPYSSSPKYYQTIANEAHTKCSWSGNAFNQSGLVKYDSNVIDFTETGFEVYEGNRNVEYHSWCQKLNGFGLSMNYLSIPVLYHESFMPLKPYWFDYASYFYKHSAKINNVEYNSHGLSLSEILDNKCRLDPNISHDNCQSVEQLNAPTHIQIPIGIINDIQSPDFVQIRQGTTLQFSYEIYITDVSPESGTTYDSSMISNAKVRLNYNGARAHSDGSYDPTYYARSISCPSNVIDDGYGLRFTWECTWTSDYDIYNNLILFGFDITPGDNQSAIWNITWGENTSNRNISFFTDSLYVITDYDDTPGGMIGGSDAGGDLSQAPGSVYNQFEFLQDDPDWTSTLTNLFGFSFINPFSPLFTMFTDSSTCANIPIIAGMLNSSETTYCSWFSSQTRTVLTPVLSISAMMLVFGFAVRWLSSSSGNMFEDQTTHKASNTQPKKGGR